jgi:hypothetical protein
LNNKKKYIFQDAWSGPVEFAHKQTFEFDYLARFLFKFKSLQRIKIYILNKQFIDGRCDEDFLNNLPIKSISDLNSGYGCASLFWYARNDPTFLNQFNMAGTIHDYITFL